MISSKTLGEALARRLSEKHTEKEALEAVKEFASYLVKEGRTSQIPRILETFKKTWNELKNEVDVTLEYAGEKPSFPSNILEKNVNVAYKEADELIAGMKVTLEDYLIDASLSGRLNKIKNITR